MKRLIINPGDKYNKLTIIKEVEKKGQNRFFLCKCDCGNEAIVHLPKLRNGNTKSCGCLNNGNNKKHLMTNTRIYSIWCDIKRRCNNTNRKDYKNYGGRGIKCLWNNFEEFYNDMGETYIEGLTIERNDVNGNYCKENCRWATSKEQARNRRNTLIFEGKPLIQWCEELGIKYTMILNRINRGWSFERALFTKKR